MRWNGYDGARIFPRREAQRAVALEALQMRIGLQPDEAGVALACSGPLQPLKRPVGFPAERVHAGDLEQGRRSPSASDQFSQSGVSFLLSSQRVIRERLPV